MNNYSTNNDFKQIDSVIIVQNVKENTVNLGQGLEKLLDGPLEEKISNFSFLEPLMNKKDYDMLLKTKSSLSSNLPYYETTFNINTLKGNIKTINLSIQALFANDEIVQIIHVFKDVTDYIFIKDELDRLNRTVRDVQEATQTSMHFLGADGKYVWTPESYALIDRDPRDADEFNHIIFDLMDVDERAKFERLFDELGPGEFLGSHIATIVTESGETKYLQIDARKLFDDDGNFLQRSEYAQDITPSVLQNQELNSLNRTVADVQASTGISVHFKGADGKYVWTPESYNIIGRKPRPSDEKRHIILDLMNHNERAKFEKLFDELGPGEFLGSRMTSIVTESGETKYLQIDARKLFDDDGNFLQRSEYAQDVTETVLRNRELVNLNATVEDVQQAANISVHYQTPNGKHIWTPETYKIINRQPRASDEKYNIILDLADYDDRIKYEQAINDLEPNEFLGKSIIPITTESGERKFLQVDARKLHDEEGNFVQISGYAQDVTESFSHREELDNLNATVSDVQTATGISVHYMGADGKYVWTPETYRIIDRKPRESDINRHIIFDLMGTNERLKFEKLFEELGPGEFLGSHRTKISTESGKTKYLQIDARKLFDKEGKFLQRSEYAQDVTETVLKNKELESLNATVADVQQAANISVHYQTPDGKYVWTPETYRIIDREPRSTDSNHHIMLDLVSYDERTSFLEDVSKMQPNEFLGTRMMTIVTESGKTKYLQVDARKLYDEEGNFLQKSGYAQDITEIVLKNRELVMSNATVQDVQKAAHISIHYVTPDGTFVWNPEVYEIIEREPRDSDKYNNIIMDLMDPKERVKLQKMLDDLEPNEFLGNQRISITTELGNIKYLEADARKLYDKNGLFLQKSGYAKDITKQVEYENDLIRSDAEKTILIKEVHHRVKNNLQLINSFINLEKRFHGDDPQRIIEITKKRIDSLALIHEKIYNETNMNFISCKSFIEDFDSILFELSINDEINFINDIEDITLVIDTITPLTLIINELTLNTYKYAFDDDFVGEKNISKSLSINEDDNGRLICEFTYADNGKGLPDDFDYINTKSLGFTIITSLSEQLDGQYEFFNDNGFNYVIKFPLRDESYGHWV